MNKDVISEWKQNHKGAYTDTLSDVLCEAWARCKQIGVDPWAKFSPRYSKEKFINIKNQSRRIYVYAKRAISYLQDYYSNEWLGFAFFNPSGIPLSISGSNAFMEWASSKGMLINTDWSERILGANAISVGLKNLQATQVVGAENYCFALTDTAIYFAPILLGDSERNLTCYGGVALITPYDFRNNFFMGTVSAVVYGIKMTAHLTGTLHSLYSKMDVGLLVLDISNLTGTISVSYYNDELFKILGISRTKLDFLRAETIFDPPPENEKLWDIVQNMRVVNNLYITLSVRGIKKDYIITTTLYNHHSLNLRGIRLLITTPHRVASQISKHMGNAPITFDNLIGKSDCFVSTVHLLKHSADSDANILLLGESGVGKDVIAQAIHNASNRRKNPFIAVNCAALPRDLIASELFGYEGGAFTGSKRDGNIGKFELANTGTIFLDEIGDMPLDLQAVLLRVIEQKSFMRIGSNRTTNVDVKIISATNADLLQLVKQKRFRLDLYYRLSTLKFIVPPLRERGQDIILLAEHFINAVAQRLNLSKKIILSEKAKQFLMEYPWPGNVRELQNVIEGIVTLYNVDVIEKDHIVSYIGPTEYIYPQHTHKGFMALETRDFAQRPKDLTEEQIKDALIVCKYNKSYTAKYLGISRRTLYRKMKEFKTFA